MANDIRCRNCGRTETQHIIGPLDDEIFSGYSLSLTECITDPEAGYNPDPKEIEKYEKQEEAEIEKTK